MALGFMTPEEIASPAQMEMRKRIALGILANSKRSGYPRNIGEGLTSIGDSLGEYGQLKMLDSEMARYEAAKRAEKAQSDQDTPTPGGARPVADAGTVPPVQVASVDPAPAAVAPPVDPPVMPRAPVVPPPRPPAPIASAPPPQVSPMSQQAALTPTDLPNGVFPSTPQTASSAPPSQLALPPTANRMAIGGADGGDVGAAAVLGLNNSVGAVNQMGSISPQSRGFPALGRRSDVAGPLNDAQSSQMAELMGGPPQAPPSPYGATASLAGAGGTLSDADPAAQTRNAIALSLGAQNPAAGVPQPNPTQGAALPPSDTASLGSPPDAANNRPIMTDMQPAPAEPVAVPGAQMAQAYQGSNLGPLARPKPLLPPGDQMPPSVPPSGTPATPIPPAPEEPRAFVPPSAAKPLPEPAVPARVLPGPEQLLMEKKARDAEDADLKIYYTDKAAKFEADRAAQDTRAMEKWKADHQAWEQDRARLHQYYLETPTREQTIKKGMDEGQARERAQKIEAQLGGIPAETWLANLKTGKEQTAGIPAATQSIKRARDLVENNKMYFGTFADTNTTLAKVMSSAGFPLDPKASGTEQFKQAMGGIMAQARKAIVGPGAQSDREMGVLQAVTGADAKLTPDTIRAALDAAERLNLMMALQHQKEVRQFAGEDDPNRKAAIYRAYGVPNMADLVPQASVNKLFKFSSDPKVHQDFDNTYHTPGLSREILRYRRPQ